MLVSPPLKTKGTARTRTRKHSRTSGVRFVWKISWRNALLLHLLFFAQKCACTTKRNFGTKSRNLWKMFLRLVLHFLQAFRVHIAFPACIPVLFPLFISSYTSTHCIFPSIIFHFFLTFFQKSRAMSDVSRSIVVSEWLFLQYVIAANKKNPETCLQLKFTEKRWRKQTAVSDPELPKKGLS